MIGQTFFENLGESANPVFIKEMRQYFQNRRMVLLMGLLLLVEFICTLFFSSASNYSADGEAGVVFFLLVLLFGTGVAAYIVCAVIFPPAPQEATAQDYAAYSQPYTPPQDAVYEQQPQPEPQPQADEQQPE